MKYVSEPFNRFLSISLIRCCNAKQNLDHWGEHWWKTSYKHVRCTHVTQKWSTNWSSYFVGICWTNPRMQCCYAAASSLGISHFYLPMSQEDSQGHKFGSAPVGRRLFSLFTCHIWLWQSAFFRDSYESEFIWKARSVQMEWRSRLFLSANTLTESESAFPGTYSYSCSAHQSQYSLSGQKNQSSAHLRNIREETHRLVPTGCIAN